MKKHILHIALYIFIVSILAGCEQKEADTNATVANYAELIEQIKLGMEEGFSTVTTDDLGISVVFNYASDRMGYCYMDLNNDGTEELLLGANGEGAWDNVIYDVFTMTDGKMIRVLSGRERDRFYLTDKGTCVFANEGSGGASNSFYAYIDYSDEGLELIESVIYDSWKDEEHPWFYSNESISAEGADSINEETAKDIIASYKYQEIEFTPFRE